jgi:hypothetical protein
LDGHVPATGSPAARVEGSRNRVGVSCSGGATGTARPAVGKNSGKGVPVAGRGRKVVEKLQGEVGMLGVEAIQVEEDRRKVSHGEQKAAAVKIAGSSSGSWWGALGDQLKGRRASRG